MGKTVLVTGATGKIGSLLVPKLKAAGADVRALVRSTDKGQKAKQEGADIVLGDFDQPETLKGAMQGVDTLVLITPPGPEADRQSQACIEAAKEAGVKNVVRISAIIPDERRPTDNTRQHAETDEILKASGLSFTILRPHAFMQNIFASAGTIAQDGKMYWGMGDGKMGMIDVRDIADVAAKVVMEEGHDGIIYDLTGPESISFHDVARELSEALDREISYLPVPPEAVESSMKQLGAGDWMSKLMRDYSEAYASGWGDFVTEDVEKVLGRKPRSIREFIREVLVPSLKLASA